MEVAALGGGIGQARGPAPAESGAREWNASFLGFGKLRNRVLLARGPARIDPAKDCWVDSQDAESR
jgi:hypothetical protein